MKRVLSLDLATVCGWALLGGGVITSGSQSFARYTGCKSRPADHPGETFAKFHRWLANKVREDKPDVLAFEEMSGFYKGQHTPRLLYGLRGVMMSVAAAYGAIPCFGYDAASVKKFWAGKGNAKKPDMVAATRERCPGVDLTDDNEADALAILHLHLERNP